MIERTTREENAKSKQIITVAHKRYDDNMYQLPPGIYTEKEIHIREFMPAFVKIFVPERGSVLIEKVCYRFQRNVAILTRAVLERLSRALCHVVRVALAREEFSY